MIFLNVFLVLFLSYLLIRYIFIPVLRKKAILIYGKIIFLMCLTVIALISLYSFSLVSLIAILPFAGVAVFAYALNLNLVLGSTKEDIIKNISKVTLGMNLESQTENNLVSIPSLQLKIHISHLLRTNILRFKSEVKSDKLKLLQTVIRKFITA